MSVPFGRRLFWESLPELLLVLMLCDNNLSCLLLVYAGDEKALCAARGAGCQLGSVRLSLCAPRLQPPQQNPQRRLGGAHGQGLAPHRRGGTAAAAPGHLLPFTPLGGGNAGELRQMFPPKENISSSWCHLPPGCLSGIPNSKKSLGQMSSGTVTRSGNQALIIPACLEP